MMITATVGDLLDGTLWDKIHEHVGERPGIKEFFEQGIILEISEDEYTRWETRCPKIYVVRDSETVFYVGKSEEPSERLLSHVGRGQWGWGGPSILGRTIKDNLPEARSWTIELWSVQECKDALADETTMLWRWDKDQAEQAMMRERRPCLNIVHNINGRRLPDRYRNAGLKARIENPPEDLIDYG